MIRILSIVLVFSPLWTWTQRQDKNQKSEGTSEARLLGTMITGDDGLNMLYRMGEELEASFNPKEDYFAIRVCSNDPLPIALPMAVGVPFLTTIKMEKRGVPKSRIYYLRQNKNCQLPTNGYAQTEYWLIPKGAEFPVYVEARNASNLTGIQFVHRDTLEKGDRSEVEEKIDEVTPQTYAAILEKVVALLKEHKSATTVLEVFYYKRSSPAELNKRVADTTNYLRRNGISQYRIHIKRVYSGPDSPNAEKYPDIFVVVEN
ncbi:MAG TPA: hypothetical protein VGQ41_04940 [Pyrinomonadaceae bacterium]|jgi:hypothetical protein|nr:hypothetical protein [Pyrinomonadaceae bacterium]